MKKPKLKIKINNKLKAYGTYDTESGVMEINRKKHKDKRELADTVAHELSHRRHPRAKEKTIQKMNAPEISSTQQNKLVAKLRMKKLNYKIGATKRKFKMGAKKTEPGEFISKVNENKVPRLLNTNSPMTAKKLAILGLV